jgi:hypothetical protein
MEGRVRMKNISIKKAIAVLTVAILLGVLPMAASAATKMGWIEKGTDWYYGTSDGSYQKGWMKDNTESWYYFDSNGVMQKDTTITTNGYEYVLGSDGAWIGSEATINSDKGVVNGATYKLINAGSGKALDVYAGATNDYANVDIYDDNNTGAQKWTIYQLPDGTYKLINTISRKALDVYAAEKDDYADVDIYTENGTDAQRWSITANYDGTYKLINVGSGKALDVYAAGIDNYTNVDVYTDNGTNAQRWNLVRIE